MAKKDDRYLEVEDGREFTSRTIVGGRPRSQKLVRLNVPVGIEKTLYRAAVDPGFRRRLLEDRAGAARSRGTRLTEMEASILETIPDERLALMIDRIQPRRHGKRRFMKTVASAVVTLATGTAVIATEGCTQAPDGARPDDVGVDQPTDTLVDEGEDAVEDVPEDVEVDLEFPDAVDGISPDAPPDVPLDEEDAGEEG